MTSPTRSSSVGLRPDVRVVLSPAWSTDWITAEGRKALSDAGIAPPARSAADRSGPDRAVAHAAWTSRPARSAAPPTVEELARFGSTACKALWRCRSCREPFDYVKPL